MNLIDLVTRMLGCAVDRWLRRRPSGDCSVQEEGEGVGVDHGLSGARRVRIEDQLPGA